MFTRTTFFPKIFSIACLISSLFASINAEDVLIILFAEQTGLFRQPNVLNNACQFVHTNLSASLATASLVTIIFWKASNCSVFTRKPCSKGSVEHFWRPCK